MFLKNIFKALGIVAVCLLLEAGVVYAASTVTQVTFPTAASSTVIVSNGTYLYGVPTSTLGIIGGGTGPATSTNPLMATYFVGTSTSATSTLGYGLNLTGGCVAVNGTCVTGSGSSYTSTVLNTFATTTTTIWIDGNRTDTYTPDGTILRPYKTIASAIQTVPAVYHIAPLSNGAPYVETSNLTFNATSTLYGEQAPIVDIVGGQPGTITFSTGVIAYNMVIGEGNVSLTATGVSQPGTFQNSFINGNITMAGLATYQGGQLQGGLIYTMAGSLTNFTSVNILEPVDTSGTVNLNDVNLQPLSPEPTVAGGYAIIATTTGSAIDIVGISLENNATTGGSATGGGIYCANGATSNPNELSSFGMQLGTTTLTGVMNCGTSATNLGEYNAFDNVPSSPTQVFVTISNFVSDSFASLNVEGNTLLNVNGGLTGIGTSTPTGSLTIQGTTTTDLFDVASSTGKIIFRVINTSTPTSTATNTFAGPNGVPVTIGNYDNTNASTLPISPYGLLNVNTYDFSKNSTACNSSASCSAITVHTDPNEPYFLSLFNDSSTGGLTTNANMPVFSYFGNGNGLNEYFRSNIQIFPTDFFTNAGPIEAYNGYHVGIGGTTTPTNGLLSIQASGGSTSTPSFIVASSSNVVADLFIIQANGNIGIGTSSPYNTLSVVGTTTSAVFEATSTATSTFGGGLNLKTGCLSYNGTCISTGGGGSGTVTSVATNNGLTGGTITTTGTIGLNITGLSTNALTTWNGSNLVATGTPTLYAGNYVATSSTASYFVGNIGIGSSTASYPLVASSTEVSAGTNDIFLDTSNNNFSAGGPILTFAQKGSIQATIQGSEGSGGTNPYLLTAIPSGTANTTLTGIGFGIGTTSPFSALTLGSGTLTVAENKLATSTSMTVSWNAGNQQLVQIGTAGVTIAFSNVIDGGLLRLITCSPGSGTAGTITWPATVNWGVNGQPNQTTTANHCDTWSFLATQGTSTAGTATPTIFGSGLNF